MSRSQWILSGILAVQVLLLVLTAPWSRGGSGETARELLPELASFTPARLEIHENDERSVTLERDGEAWVIEDAGGYPADGSKVDELLSSLEEIRVRKPVVSSSRYHGALKVRDDDHERRLRIWESGDDEPKVELLVGTSPNYRLSHVRLGGEDRVYEARGISPYELGSDSGAWIDKKFVDVPFDNVTRFKLSNDHGAIELEREDGSWKLVAPAAPAGKDLDGAAVDSLVRSMTSLRLSEPAGRVDPGAQGFADPAAVVEIEHRAPEVPEFLAEGQDEDAVAGAAQQTSPEVVTLRLGAEVEGGDGKRYASRSGFDYAAVLSKFDADKLVDNKLTDLLSDD